MTDTIAALATPRGESAIALIRISGPETRAVARDRIRVIGAAVSRLFFNLSAHAVNHARVGSQP